MKTYASPLVERYASRAMSALFSAERKFSTWRRLWVELARAERELGLDISEAQIRELEAHVDDLNLERANELERELRHDVMAHIRAFGEQCPGAKGIIHLGATSMFVVDNTDIILARDALRMIRDGLAGVCRALARFAEARADLPTVAFTHFQPAQFTTVGRRACLWLQDFMMDLESVDQFLKDLRFRGTKGATGTQASFLSLFGGDGEKVRELDRKVSRAFGFDRVWPITGQTVSRKFDSRIHGILSGVAESAHKFSNDIRLLQHLGEVLEPFGKKQVGSSAMAYKRNPMKSERTASLSRLVIVLAQNAAFTTASQWFERTLDDSAGKRIALPEAFMGADAVLQLVRNVGAAPDVQEAVIRRNVERELPFTATENILMSAVRAGGDRQALHERIRRHSLDARERMVSGERNDLMDRLAADEAFSAIRDELKSLCDPSRYTGRSVSQVKEYMEEHVRPVLGEWPIEDGAESEVRV